MKRLLDRLDLYFEKTPDWIRRHRLLVGMVLLLASRSTSSQHSPHFHRYDPGVLPEKR